MPNAIFAMSATGGRLVDRVRRVLGAPEPRGSQRGSVAAAILILVLSIAAATTFVRGAAAGTGRHRNTTADAVSPASRASGQDAATPAAPISRSAPARSEPSTSAAPTPAASPDGATVAQSDARRHVALLDDGSAEWRDSAGWLTIRRRGRIVLSDDDMDIVRMDPGAHFILSEGISWLPGFLQDLLTTRRILEFRGRADGSIQRQFRVGGQPHAYQPEGAAWLREMLPRIAPRMTETIALAGERQRAIAALNAGPQAQATPPNDAALADQEAIRRALVEAQAQIAKLRSQLPSAAGNAERMQKQLIAASAQLRAQSDLAQLLAEIERMRTELAVREASLSAQQRELDALRKAIEDLRTAMERGGSNAR